ncbi:MAG: hypothetical protein RL189_1298 [Pseudomonadota bacterium]|jgi:hypothetical protein
MKNSLTLSGLVFFAVVLNGCNSSNQAPTAPKGTTSNQAGSGNGAQNPSTQAPAHLLPIPAGNAFVASCMKTLKVSINQPPSSSMTEAGKEAFKVVAELSQSGGVKICSEHFTSGDDTQKSLLAEDRRESCRVTEGISAAVFSLKDPCPAPQTGSQSLEKSVSINYFRSTLYISGATPEQLKKLNLGWNELEINSGSGESKRTDDLR